MCHIFQLRDIREKLPHKCCKLGLRGAEQTVRFHTRGVFPRFVLLAKDLEAHEDSETSRHVRSSPPLHTPTTVTSNFTLHFLFGLRQFGSSQEDERRLEDVEVQDRSLRRLSENIHHGSSPFALAPISKQHATVTTKSWGDKRHLRLVPAEG